MKAYLKLFRYLLPFKIHIIFTWIISIFLLALDGISIWIAAGFLEKIISGKTLVVQQEGSNVLTRFLDHVSVNILQQSTPFKSLLVGAVALIGARLFISLLRIIKLYIFARVDESILKNIRQDLFKHVTRLDISFSKKFRPGEISSIFLKDVDQLHFALINTADRLFLQPLRLILALVLLFLLSIKITLVILIFLLLGGIVIHFFGERVEEIWKISLEKTAQIQGHITEYLSAVILSRSLGKEAYEAKRFSDTCEDLKQITIKRAIIDLLAPQSITVMAVLVYAVLIIGGGYEVLVAKSLSGGTLLKMALLLPLATYSIEALATVYTSLRGSGASAKRVFALMDEPINIFDKPDARDAEPISKGIKFLNVSHRIEKQTILENMNFFIRAGSITVVYGPSGAGKTTILNLVAGFIRPTGGKILIDNTDICRLKINSWRGHLGIITQDPILLNGTIRENLLYALPDADDGFLVKILKKTLLWDESGSVFPNGLDTQVGNRGEMLSGGERQRLTIARALLNNPHILLMDEPTTMLDYDSKTKIIETIKTISPGKTIIIVTHDPVLRKIADCEILIEDGQLIRFNS
jgi:subfamily B ATP-binding cassette protein MsbA